MAKRNGIIKALIQIGLILVVLALIFFSLNSVLPGFIDVLANGQQSDVQEYLNSFHDFSGYAIGFLLQFIQIITIALPSVPIQVAVGDQLVEGDFLSAALYVAPLLLFAGLLLWQRKNILSLYEKIKQRTAEHKARK